ncbi:hypothetical protein OLVG_00243 [Ostreococcus lucimarinus virus OlV6]|uniref:hypothetical protein n=1 Tax=Ostreococcus lucimarinus virus OlV5 TaxID=754064 RepID=UPI00026335FA|nr:hypothetical protein OLNG_00250 [Ostreococcus lucimarinus virus OlV5]AFK65997.1 hypothetical protein OLVG_00243 [Ostreococcus lucimarinus virus OlV6]AGH31319.1 hypothetical protein OLNG_00250 [Ostreococcus lucimarinus virus OlV5]
MSERPRRNPKPIQRIENEQARNAEAAAARAAARPRTAKPRTVKPKTVKPSTAVATARSGVLPKGKDTLIPRLIPLISQVTSDTDLQHFLISIYDETSNDEYTKSLFGGKTDKEAKDKIAVHADLFSKKLYRGSSPQMSFTLKGDDMINLAYLMYLDMLHDETIKKDMTFQTFCKENITVSVKVPAPTKKDKRKTKMVKKTQKSPVYILFGTGLKPKMTDFIKTVQGFIDESGGKAEIAVKSNLPSIYSNILKKEVTIRKDQVSPRILTPGHNMFLSVDQEDEKATVTLDIQRTKYQLPNGTEGKIMYPLVSVANLMDPGKNMLIESAKEDSKYFMLGLNNRDIRSRLTWNYKQPKFTINHDNGSSTIEAYYTDIAQITNNTNTNRKTKRGYAYRITNNKGEYRFPSNMSKAKAQTGSTGEKVAKFLGDFLQALTVTSYVKNNNNPKYHYCLATGDAMLANNFLFLCSRSGVSPNLWMATSTKQVSKVYGKMIDDIQIVKPAPTLVRNAPNVNERNANTNNEASSGSNRTEGGGNSNNRGFFGRIFGGNKKPANSGVVNKKPVNNGVRRMNVNNTASVAGSSSGSVSRNNNNNNVTSNNRRGQKRVRNNNANVNQPPAKKINVMRNRLIQNLKKKNLPNFVINGLVKSYDNKQKTANQIIREANNFSKTFTMGKTAQRIGTLRKR